MKTPSPIVFALSVALASIQSTTQAAPIVSESFGYEVGTTIVGQGGAVDGWAGAWTTSGGTDAEFEIVVAELTFGDLDVAGGAS